MVLRLLALCVTASLFPWNVSGQSSQDVPVADARNVYIPVTKTHMPLPDFHSLAEWEKRKAFLREQILLSAGLLPMPAKTPLHPQIFGRIQGSGYTIEKVLIETMPGFYLGGNLYRPTGQGSRHPGVLNPHGHWPYGRLENQPLYSGPALGISLARQGYVVFAYDMVGYTDTLQVPHNFTSPKYSLWDFGPLGLQLWNSIRSLDFLASLPDVDPANLGVTGASGGGTQTFLLTAVDDRVQFASPVNMVSAIMQGGDACEFAPGLRIGTSNVEIAAMFAPKPMLLVSATGDWTRNVPHEEYPAIRRIYDLYGKGSNVDVVQIQARHNFNQQSREAVYRFFAKVNPGLSNPAELAEHDIGIPVLQDMMALSNKTLPSNALDLDGLFKEWKTRDLESVNQILDPSVKREFLRQTLKVEVPREVAMKQDGSRIILSRPEFKDRVAGYWFAGHGTPAVVVDPFGAEAALKSTEFATLKKEHRPIFVLDAFQTGNAKSPRDESDPAFLAYNVSDDQARVQDVITAMSHMKGNHAAMDVYATGDASLWSIFASAVVPWKVTLHLSNIPKLESDEDYLLHFGIPGIERAGGLSLALQLVQVKS